MGAPGDRVGRYELVAPLGHGGYGEVWEAVLHGPRGFRKPVALKRLTARGVSESLIEEARLGAWLSHPNVVETYELVEVDGDWLLSMELVRGATASDLVRQGPLSGVALRDLGVQAARALAHVHTTRVDGRALVHRDVKPANLLVDRTGTVKLADFGIARLVGADGPIAGTPGFLAPEQLEGHEGPGADLFALGVTLCVLATRRRPFGRGLEARLALEDPEGAWAQAGLDGACDLVLPGLGALVGRCLRRDPSARPASAQEVGDTLAAMIAPAGEDLRARLARTRPGLDVEASTRPPAITEPTRVLPRGHLPRRTDAFVGRDDERREVAAALRAHRLVTLLGPGGAGKTRLALEVAADGAPPGGAWFCALEHAVDAAGVADGVARVLGATLVDGEPVARVADLLAGRGPTWLVLDNLEQVTGPAGRAVATWLAAAPDLRVLATSRVPLHLAEEHRLSLGPLEAAAAADLFTRRAARAPTADQAGDVARIVAALDHLPLPIELAAAWTRLLPPAGILERLADRFRLLVRGPVDAPERHRSLRACLDGSFALLSPGERRAIGALSLFEVPFAFQAAERVLPRDPDAPWVLDVLSRLVDTSLLLVEGDRFRMLQSVREYAAEALSPAERRAAEEAHGAWFADAWSPWVIAELDRVDPVAGPARLADELPDLVAACRRAVNRRDALVASVTARAAAAHFTRQGPLPIGLALLREALAAHPGDEDLRVALARLAVAASDFREAEQVLADVAEDRALVVRAAVHRGLERMEASERVARRAWEEAGARGDDVARYEAACAVGLTLRIALRIAEARTWFDTGLRLAQDRGDRRAAAQTLLGLGTTGLQAGDQRAAKDALEQALALFRQLADRRAEAVTLANLGLVEKNLGNPDRAEQALRTALDLQRALGLRHAVAQTLGNLASMAPFDESLALLDEARALHAAHGNTRSEAIVIGNRGMRLLASDPVAARTHLEDALARHRALGNPLDESVMENALADLDRTAGRLDAAEERLRAVLARVSAADLKRPWIQCLIHLAEVAADRGDEAGSVRWLADAHALAVRVGDGRATELATRLAARPPNPG